MRYSIVLYWLCRCWGSVKDVIWNGKTLRQLSTGILLTRVYALWERNFSILSILLIAYAVSSLYVNEEDRLPIYIFFDRDQASSRTIILYCLYVHLIPVSQGLIQGLISNIPESSLSYVLVLLQLPGDGCILVFDSEEAWISLMALIFMESCKPSSCSFATFALWTVNITRYALPYVSEAVASLYVFILSHATARPNFGFLLAYRLVGSKLAYQLYRDGKPIYLRPIDNFLTRALIRTRYLGCMFYISVLSMILSWHNFLSRSTEQNIPTVLSVANVVIILRTSVSQFDVSRKVSRIISL